MTTNYNPQNYNPQNHNPMNHNPQNPRSYMNPMTRQWVFLEYNTGYGRWFPHSSTMRSWAQGTTRVYRPLDNPATLVTMPDNLSWPAMSPSEYPYIATADVPESWVSNNQIITALNEDEIDSYDCMVSEPPPPQLTPLTMLAGILLSMGPAQQNGPPPLILSVLESESHPFITSLLQGTSLQPIQQIQTNQQIQSINPTLPPHVAAVMIQHAVNTGASCSITMEPLTAKNATVTPCGHVFDRDALSHWTTDHGSCPECRTPVAL